MAKARLIYGAITKSDKFTELLDMEHGEFSQLLYLCSYPFSDDWGHLPYSEKWLKRECLPDSRRHLDTIKESMENIVSVGLWSKPYQVDDKHYIYINKFEIMCRDGIRHRRKGEYPAENGEIPRRDKEEKIDDNIRRYAELRVK